MTQGTSTNPPGGLEWHDANVLRLWQWCMHFNIAIQLEGLPWTPAFEDFREVFDANFEIKGPFDLAMCAAWHGASGSYFRVRSEEHMRKGEEAKAYCDMAIGCYVNWLLFPDTWSVEVGRYQCLVKK